MKLAVKFFALSLLVATAGSVMAQDQLNKTRSTLQEWVKVRQQISSLRADWMQDKELLQDQVKLFEGQAKDLDEKLSKVDTGSDQIRKELQEQEKQEADYKRTVIKVKETVGALENQAKALAATFPAPLADKLQPLVKRIPEDKENTKLSVAQRTQVIVAILAEADKFNSAVTLTPEFRKDKSGAEIQVQTLYLGLAQAYYADKTGQLAGVGHPTPKGWEWSVQPELGERIKLAIAMYLNEKPAAFVSLPAKIQ